MGCPGWLGFIASRHRGTVWLHLGCEVFECVVGFLGAVRDIHQIAVDDIATQIIPERIAQLLVIFREQRLTASSCALRQDSRRVAPERKNSRC